MSCKDKCTKTHWGLPPHLWRIVFHPTHKSEVEACAKTVLEEDGGSAAVEATLREDGHPVTEKVGLIHVVGGHDHRTACMLTVKSV